MRAVILRSGPRGQPRRSAAWARRVRTTVSIFSGAYSMVPSEPRKMTPMSPMLAPSVTWISWWAYAIMAPAESARKSTNAIIRGSPPAGAPRGDGVSIRRIGIVAARIRCGGPESS